MINRKMALKPTLFVIVVILTAVILGSCSFVTAVVDRIGGSDSSGTGSPGKAAEIVFLEGSVTVNGTVAAIGDIVMDGDLVVTGEDSMAELEFGDYRVLRARAGSRLTLDSAEGLMKLDAGGLAVVQSKARRLTRQKAWLLQTPTMIAAVRGTVYYANVESADDTYFCLCNGKIHLEDEEGFIDLEASHHNAVRASRTADGVVYTEAPMLYHTDAGIESLADLVHVPIDWSVIPE